MCVCVCVCKCESEWKSLKSTFEEVPLLSWSGNLKGASPLKQVTLLFFSPLKKKTAYMLDWRTEKS